MSVLIVLRHGQSLWNQANRFTGWVDVPLSKQGEDQAEAAGQWLAKQGWQVRCLFASNLMRAQQTAVLAARAQGVTAILQHEADVAKSAFEDVGDGFWAPLHTHAALNERFYGALQGLNKQEAVAHYGAEQVQIWRRSYDTPPPQGESLADTQQRVVAYFNRCIAPKVQSEEVVLVASHGNALRALIMHLEGLSQDDIAACEIETGQARVYQYLDLDTYQRLA